MIDIDPKALALRVAETCDRISVEAPDDVYLSVSLYGPEARALAAFLREAAEGWRPIDDQARNGEEWMLTSHKYKNPSKGRWYCNGWWDGGCFRTDDGEELHTPDFYAPILPPPTPPARIEDAEEPSHG